MTEQIKYKGRAFPMQYQNGSWQTGVSLRDYMAIHASEEDVKAQIETIRAQSSTGILPDGFHIKARYMHADQMLKAREAA